MKVTLRTMAIAIATLAGAVSFSPGWSEQGGVSLSVSKAEAASRLYVGRRPYAASAVYVPAAGLSWYAVRAYYDNGPWSGMGYSYAGWDGYAAQNGIGCRPGSIVKGGDGIWYNCQ